MHFTTIRPPDVLRLFTCANLALMFTLVDITLGSDPRGISVEEWRSRLLQSDRMPTLLQVSRSVGARTDLARSIFLDLSQGDSRASRFEALLGLSVFGREKDSGTIDLLLEKLTSEARSSSNPKTAEMIDCLLWLQKLYRARMQSASTGPQALEQMVREADLPVLLLHLAFVREIDLSDALRKRCVEDPNPPTAAGAWRGLLEKQPKAAMLLLQDVKMWTKLKTANETSTLGLVLSEITGRPELKNFDFENPVARRAILESELVPKAPIDIHGEMESHD